MNAPERLRLETREGATLELVGVVDDEQGRQHYPGLIVEAPRLGVVVDVDGGSCLVRPDRVKDLVRFLTAYLADLESYRGRAR
jgi:hypothetical protein